MKKQRTYSIGEAARLSGVSVRRLRFYADEGLLPPAGRMGMDRRGPETSSRGLTENPDSKTVPT